MRPALRIDGEPAPLVDRDVIDVAMVDAPDGSWCFVTVANWDGAGGVGGYRHFDGTLDIGRRIAVTLTDGLAFEGTVVALEGRYPGNAPPTLVVRATGALADTAIAVPVTLRLGANLRSCTTASARSDDRASILTRVEGVAELDAGIRAASVIEVAGLGAPYDGRYEIAETRHRFDLSAGARSEFVATRRAVLA